MHRMYNLRHSETAATDFSEFGSICTVKQCPDSRERFWWRGTMVHHELREYIPTRGTIGPLNNFCDRNVAIVSSEPLVALNDRLSITQSILISKNLKAVEFAG